MSERLDIPLDIPDVKVEKVEVNKQGDIIITVRSAVEGTHCHRCGTKITKPYGHDREITLRHLPILGRKTFIRLRPPRYQCTVCDGQPTTTQRASWYERNRPHTTAYEIHVLRMLVNSTGSDVAVKEDLGYEAVMGIVNHHIAGEVDWNRLERLEEIGIDEIALKKGHKDFVAVVTGRLGDRTEILGVLKDRKKATVKAFFFSIPKRLRQTVRVICSDLYEGFINAAKGVFGRQVLIVADRFHVARLYRKGVEKLRQQELKRLKKTLSEEAYKELKGAMWALRQDEEDLTPEEKALIERLFQHSPRLKMAYLLSNGLTEVFEQNIPKSKAKREISHWIGLVKRSGLNCFDSFLSTLRQRREEITNYFIDRSTSGFVEGLNNKIKVIKRRCYGLLNVKHLFQRIYLDLSGYTLFA